MTDMTDMTDVDGKPTKRTLSKMTVRTDKSRIDELRRCVVWAQMSGERVTLTNVLDAAIDATITQIKKDHGEPNMPTSPQLQPGRPIKL